MFFFFVLVFFLRKKRSGEVDKVNMHPCPRGTYSHICLSLFQRLNWAAQRSIFFLRQYTITPHCVFWCSAIHSQVGGREGKQEKGSLSFRGCYCGLNCFLFFFFFFQSNPSTPGDFTDLRHQSGNNQ